MLSFLEQEVRTDLRLYASELARCLEEGAVQGPFRNALKGALVYLVDPNDLIADDTPNLGLLDDLTLLVHVTKLLLAFNDLGPTLTAERVLADHVRYKSKSGLIQKDLARVTLERMAVRGRDVQDEAFLLERVRAKIETI